MPDATDLARAVGPRRRTRVTGAGAAPRSGTTASTASPRVCSSGCRDGSPRWPRRKLLTWRGKLRAGDRAAAPSHVDRRRLDRPPGAGALRRRGPRAPRRRAGGQHLRHRHRPLQPARGAPAVRRRRSGTQPVARRATPGRRGCGDRASRRAAPIFATPRGGISQLAAATAAAIADAGGTVRIGVRGRHRSARRVHDRAGWSVDGRAVRRRDPRHARTCRRRRCSPTSRRRGDDRCGDAETADVVMVTLHVPADEWPDRLRGPQRLPRARSRCSVRSPRCRSGRRSGRTGGRRAVARSCGCRSAVTARPRSIGPTTTSSPRCSTICAATSAWRSRRSRSASPVGPERSRSIGRTTTRWVAAVEAALPSGLFVAGSSYRGIGIPACVRDGRATARRAVAGASPIGRISVVDDDRGCEQRREPPPRDRLRRFGLIGAVVALVVGGIAVTAADVGDDPNNAAAAPPVDRAGPARRPSPRRRPLHHRRPRRPPLTTSTTTTTTSTTTTSTTTTTTAPVQLTQPIAPPQDPRAAGGPRTRSAASPSRSSESTPRCTRGSG